MRNILFIFIIAFLPSVALAQGVGTSNIRVGAWTAINAHQRLNALEVRLKAALGANDINGIQLALSELMKVTGEVKAENVEQAKQITELRRLGLGVQQCLNTPAGIVPQVQETCLEQARLAFVAAASFSGVNHNAVVHEGNVVVQRTVNHLFTEALNAPNGGGSISYVEDPASGRVSAYYKPPHRDLRAERKLEEAAKAQADAEARARFEEGKGKTAVWLVRAGYVVALTGVGAFVGSQIVTASSDVAMVDREGAFFPGRKQDGTMLGTGLGAGGGLLLGLSTAWVIDF